MAKGKIVKLVGFTMPARQGQLASVSALLSGEGLSIEAFSATDTGSSTEYLVAAGSTAKTRKALAPLNVETREVEALRVDMPDKVGRLHRITEKIAAAGINIKASWATCGSGKTASALFLTADNAGALAALERKNKKEKTAKPKKKESAQAKQA
ncbi:MAG TPA: hypothetical protein VHE79_11165 [Spirochaetia bacterium]